MKLIKYTLRLLRYVITRPLEAVQTFAQAFRESMREDSIRFEESKLNSLGVAIGLYKLQFGRLPTKLDDLCFNNHQDSKWDGPFIHWRGSKTFYDSFGFPYRCSVTDGKLQLVSPGLESAKQHRDSSGTRKLA